jgi:hypothetical protein
MENHPAMKQRTLLVLSLPLALSLPLVLILVSPVFPQAQACQKDKNQKNSAYMERDGDKRCEGIITPQASLPDFGLSAFSIGQVQENNRELTLTLTVPKSPRLSEPKVQIKAITPATMPNGAIKDKQYRLEPLALTAEEKQWKFKWSNAVLRAENIQPDKLRSLAQAEPGSIFLPVRFSPSTTYDLLIYTGNNTKTITLKILDSRGNQVYIATKTDQSGTEVPFTWNGRNAQKKPSSAGRYTLQVEADIERSNAPSERRKSSRQFEHNPAWLQ